MLGPELQLTGRVHVRQDGRRLLYFGGCDYLRLARHPRVLAAAHAALRHHGLNVAASRVTTGNHPLYTELEVALARFFAVEAALVVPNGYATNLVVAQALAGDATHAFVDTAVHASPKDAAMVLGCPARTFAHHDATQLAGQLRRLPRRARPVVFTDGLDAREGTVAPLGAYLAALPATGWLVVDDAHGVGVLGTHGRGAPEAAGVASDRLIHTGTLSKAFGAYGGMVLGTRAVIDRVMKCSRQFAGSTPLPLPLAACALESLRLVASPRGPRPRLARNVIRFKQGLRALGLQPPDTPAPVISLQGADPEENDRLATRLRRAGIYPSLIRYAGGPAAGYFRFALSSEHTAGHIDRLLAALREVKGLQLVRHQ